MTRCLPEKWNLTLSDLRRDLGSQLLFVVAIVASLNLVFGWAFEVDAIVRVLPNMPAMVPTTSLAFLVSVAAAGALVSSQKGAVVAILSLFVVLILSIEPLIRNEFGAVKSSDAVAPATRLGFATLVVCLILRTFGGRTLTRLASVLGLGFLCLPLVALIGYLFDASALHSVPGLTQMSILTAVLMVFLHVSVLLLDRNDEWAIVLFSDRLGSKKVASVFPYILLLGLLACYATLKISEAGHLDPNFRFAVMSLVIMVGTAVCCEIIARNLNRTIDAEQIAQAMRVAQQEVLHQDKTLRIQADNMAVLGQVVAGVAHDFNNSLAVVRGNLDLIQEDPQNRDEYFGEAFEAIDRASRLIMQLLDFGGKSRDDKNNHRVEALISQALSLFRRVAPANIHIQFDNLSGADAEIYVDDVGFERTLLNLLFNSRDAMPKGGKISIVAERRMLLNGAAREYNGSEGVSPGPYMVISVSDTGTGMAPEVLRKATNAFFTTKTVGKGTGIGLASVQGFCQRAGGGLLIESEVGKGATITLALPNPERPTALLNIEGKVLQPKAVDILYIGTKDKFFEQATQVPQNSSLKVLAIETAQEALMYLKTNDSPKSCIIGSVAFDQDAALRLKIEIGNVLPKLRVLIVGQVFSDQDFVRLDQEVRND